MNTPDTVLIVEDDEALRILLKIMLELNGLRVITASDGVEAIDTFLENKENIGVVLSDLGLPRLGGWEAFLKMKESNPNLKGILASGFFEKNVKEEIIKSGVNTFIEKPYDMPLIISMIRNMLGNENLNK